jgi:hypothetical protein
MNEHTECQPVVELAALLRKVEKLEAEHRELERQVLRRRSFSRKFKLGAVGGTLLVAAVAVLWGQEAVSIFVDSQGNVGIGTNKPVAKLDIQQQPRIGNHTNAAKVLYVTGDMTDAGGVEFRHSNGTQGIGFGFNTIYATGSNPNQDLNVNPRGTGILHTSGPFTTSGSFTSDGNVNLGNSALYFTKTDHDWSGLADKTGQAAIENGKNWDALMIAGRYTTYQDGGTTKNTRVLDLFDRVGIGIPLGKRPETPLDVKGEIRGKLWNSQEYAWSQGSAATRMTKANHSVCFLTLVTGYFYGAGEGVEITQQGDYWVLTGKSQQKDVAAKARCIGAPDDSW